MKMIVTRMTTTSLTIHLLMGKNIGVNHVFCFIETSTVLHTACSIEKWRCHAVVPSEAQRAVASAAAAGESATAASAGQKEGEKDSESSGASESSSTDAEEEG